MGHRILLVEGHAIIRELLRMVLEDMDDVSEVLECGDGHEAVRLAARHQPDLVVTEVSLPGLNGVDTTSRIVSDHPSVKVMALTMYLTRTMVTRMLSAGATGYVAKGSSTAEMREAVRTVLSGRTYLSPQAAELVVDGFLGRFERRHSEAYELLSGREREVLQLLAEGRSTKEIADLLHISVSTVETHRRQIKRKLSIDNVADLIKFALREGLTTLEPLA